MSFYMSVTNNYSHITELLYISQIVDISFELQHSHVLLQKCVLIYDKSNLKTFKNFVKLKQL